MPLAEIASFTLAKPPLSMPLLPSLPSLHCSLLQKRPLLFYFLVQVHAPGAVINNFEDIHSYQQNKNTNRHLFKPIQYRCESKVKTPYVVTTPYVPYENTV